MVSKRSHVMPGSSGRDLQWLPRKWIIFRWILVCAWSHLLNPYEVPCYSPALQLCGYCLYFPLISHPSALHTGHIMFLLTQKYSVSHLIPRILVLPSIHISYLPFLVGKVPSSFYFLFTFPFFFFFFMSSFLFFSSFLCPFNLFFIPLPISSYFALSPPSFPFFLSHSEITSVFL